MGTRTSRSATVPNWLLVPAFLVVHGWLIVANQPEVSTAFGDVRQVYPFWLQQGLDGSWVGIDQPWVYPILAWLPILAAGVFGPEQLPTWWLVLVTVLNAAVVAVLSRGPHGAARAWVWLAILAALGPVAVGRIDSVTVPVVLLAVVAFEAGRYFLAGALVTGAAWMKVWPGVVWLAMLVVGRGRGRLVLAGVAVSAVVVGVSLALGSGGNVLSFVAQQGGRGLQIESVAATVFHVLGAPVEYHDQMLTYQVVDGTADRVAATLTWVLVLVVSGIVVLGIRRVRRTGVNPDTLAWLSLALVMAVIVCNSVGSPQFVAWLAIPAVLLVPVGSVGARRAVGAIIVIALLSQLIYPWLYSDVVSQSPLGVALLVARNGLEVALLVAAIAMLAKPTTRTSSR